METEPNGKQESYEITKKQTVHKLDNRILKSVKTGFIILDVSILKTVHFSAK